VCRQACVLQQPCCQLQGAINPAGTVGITDSPTPSPPLSGAADRILGVPCTVITSQRSGSGLVRRYLYLVRAVMMLQQCRGVRWARRFAAHRYLGPMDAARVYSSPLSAVTLQNQPSSAATPTQHLAGTPSMQQRATGGYKSAAAARAAQIRLQSPRRR
jgi:hypothetical protein